MAGLHNASVDEIGLTATDSGRWGDYPPAERCACKNPGRIAKLMSFNRGTISSMGRPRPAFLFALCLVFGMGAGVVADRWTVASLPPGAGPDFRLIAQAWNVIEHNYVDRPAINSKALTYGAISGMVDALGDTGHSVFLTPQMLKRLGVIESGKLKGVGLEVQMKDRHVVIVAPIDNSPAQRAGLRSGDIILDVDGQDIAGLPLEQVARRISGPVGTSVDLSVLDPRSHRLRSVTLVRATIRIQSVSWQRLPGSDIADVRIARFNKGAAEELRQALRGIRSQHLRGVILDLRDNPGGELDEAVGVASQFLTQGNVLLVKGAKGKITPVPVKPGGLDPNLPMAVLVNGGTASAAEIVAGALQDAHRAILVGETTFGTGTVLRQFSLANGAALLLAVQEWLTPSGRSFWHKGIAPELEVVLASDANLLVPAAERKMTTEELRSSNDKQLLRGLHWIAQKIAAEKAVGGVAGSAKSIAGLAKSKIG